MTLIAKSVLVHIQTHPRPKMKASWDTILGDVRTNGQDTPYVEEDVGTQGLHLHKVVRLFLRPE